MRRAVRRALPGVTQCAAVFRLACRRAGRLAGPARPDRRTLCGVPGAGSGAAFRRAGAGGMHVGYSSGEPAPGGVGGPSCRDPAAGGHRRPSDRADRYRSQPDGGPNRALRCCGARGAVVGGAHGLRAAGALALHSGPCGGGRAWCLGRRSGAGACQRAVSRAAGARVGPDCESAMGSGWPAIDGARGSRALDGGAGRSAGTHGGGAGPGPAHPGGGRPRRPTGPTGPADGGRTHRTRLAGRAGGRAVAAGFAGVRAVAARAGAGAWSPHLAPIGAAVAR